MRAIWARGDDVAREIDERHVNSRYLAEGAKTAVTVHALAARCDVPMPICEEIYKVVSGEISPSQAYRGLLPSLLAGHESDPG